MDSRRRKIGARGGTGSNHTHWQRLAGGEKAIKRVAQGRRKREEHSGSGRASWKKRVCKAQTLLEGTSRYQSAKKDAIREGEVVLLLENRALSWTHRRARRERQSMSKLVVRVKTIREEQG